MDDPPAAAALPSLLNTQPYTHTTAQEPNEAELEDFLINQLGFNPDRVKSGIAKLKVRPFCSFVCPLSHRIPTHIYI